MASKPTEMCVIETTGAREYKVWVYFHRLLSFFYREREREKSAE
jgi:dolichol kinase